MDEKKRLLEGARYELTERILPFWLTRDLDPAGGFSGAVDMDGNAIKNAPRCLILNARILWTFSSAWRILHKPEYLEAANHAYAYLRDFFIDREFGGAYYELNADGSPKECYKLVYGQAFAIYGLAEYCRATGNQEALDLAVSIFEALEAHAYDTVNKGYIEVLRRDFSRYPLVEWPRSMANGCEKSMNTHLHLIEAYTALLRVWRNERMAARVREHLNVMLDHIVNRDIGHYHMYLNGDWTPVGRDISFGHDIEGSWLMKETCDVLGEKAASEKALPIIKHMAEACWDESIAPDGSMLNEFKPDENRYDTVRVWWVQAEAVVGMLNAWQMTGEEKYLAASDRAFAYIRKYMIEPKTGEWLPTLNDMGKPTGRGHILADGWKCPYHNGRMCMELIERLEKC